MRLFWVLVVIAGAAGGWLLLVLGGDGAAGARVVETSGSVAEAPGAAPGAGADDAGGGYGSVARALRAVRGETGEEETASGGVVAAPEGAASEGARATGRGPEVEHRGDGSTVLDGRYVVRGKGSARDPYTITWELLMSAQETYQPILGMRELPGRVEFVSGQLVRLEGHVMVPVVGQRTDELLLMKASWDECCLGMPPTPYDSVEVMLTGATRLPESKHAYAEVTGTLVVEPYLANDQFLIGLYMIENAEVRFTTGL